MVRNFWTAKKVSLEKKRQILKEKRGIVNSNILWSFFRLLILFKLFLFNLRTNRSISDTFGNKIDSHANVRMGGECGGAVCEENGSAMLVSTDPWKLHRSVGDHTSDRGSRWSIKLANKKKILFLKHAWERNRNYTCLAQQMCNFSVKGEWQVLKIPDMQDGVVENW